MLHIYIYIYIYIYITYILFITTLQATYFVCSDSLYVKFVVHNLKVPHRQQVGRLIVRIQINIEYYICRPMLGHRPTEFHAPYLKSFLSCCHNTER